MKMRRVFYVYSVIQEPDPRMAGVPRQYGQAVDVPEELAEELLKDEAYSDRLVAPITPTIEPPADAGWREAEPGSELTIISGIGPARAKILVEHGFATLAELAAMTREEVREIEIIMPGTDRRSVLAWIKDASEIVGG